MAEDIRIKAEPKFNSQEVARELLELAQVSQPPTNAEAIAEYMNLRVEQFSHYDINRYVYEIDKDIRAFLIPSQRIIGVHESLNTVRRKFSILHEIGHFLLPGHATHPSLVNDRGVISDKPDTFAYTGNIIKLEIEANQFASDMIFQLERFDIRAQNLHFEWNSILKLKGLFDTSIEATARRWVEMSKNECALIVFKERRKDDDLECTYTITSKSFKYNYFEHVIESGTRMSSDTIIYNFFHNRQDYPDILHVDLHITIAGRGDFVFDLSLFNNYYSILGLVTPKE